MSDTPATSELDRRPESKWSMVGKDPYAMPIDKIDLAHPGIWQENEFLPFLKRLREEAPVHYCAESATGPYWSVMKYKDIMTVDTSPHIYSSEPTIGIVDSFEEFTVPSFISMDPPKHDEQRRVVQGVVAPTNLKSLEGLIRQRAAAILDDLPIGEEFDCLRRYSTFHSKTAINSPFGLTLQPRFRVAASSAAMRSDGRRCRIVLPRLHGYGTSV